MKLLRQIRKITVMVLLRNLQWIQHSS